MSNAGALPIKLRSLGFESGACEWQGLKVIDCDKTKNVEILPSTNLSVRLSFTPDCSCARMRVDMVADTSVGTFKRKVEASVSAPELESCYRYISRAGAAGVLHGERHGWLCVGVALFLVALCAFHARASKRPFLEGMQARPAGRSEEQPESKTEETGKQGHAWFASVTEENRAKAVARLESMRSPGPKGTQGETVLQSTAAASVPCTGDLGPPAGKGGTPSTSCPSLARANGRDNGTSREKRTRGSAADQPAGLNTVAPAAAATTTVSSAPSVPGKGSGDEGAWKTAGVAKSAKASARRGKMAAMAMEVEDTSACGPPQTPADAALGSSFPPVTGTFDMVKDPVYHMGAAAPWSLQDSSNGQMPPLLPSPPPRATQELAWLCSEGSIRPSPTPSPRKLPCGLEVPAFSPPCHVTQRKASKQRPRCVCSEARVACQRAMVATSQWTEPQAYRLMVGQTVPTSTLYFVYLRTCLLPTSISWKTE